jgi:nitroimidazol reductase NimA-like FMN-containing flavoprotein (pyridoxamine 5'-phosphate oxidase superfamily)
MEKKPFKLPLMSNVEVKNLLDQENICRIAFKGDEFPYMAPFQYITIGNVLYFHFTNYGKKMRLLKKDKKVCVSIESLVPDMSEYRFVVLRGELEKVEDTEEREIAIRKLSEFGRKRLSENFLAAHGFSPAEGWGSLLPEKSLVIYKLENVSETIGLKSPT